jgi:hypothetical protein
VAESFFATLKVELVYECTWLTHADARRGLFDSVSLRERVAVHGHGVGPLRARAGLGADHDAVL